ncbi:MAG: hypothetical protein HKL85_11080 [Acidimicrobiaceae bacterium]|nr:hypothetical protein [Acidimicrobiaceae bacterium]
MSESGEPVDPDRVPEPGLLSEPLDVTNERVPSAARTIGENAEDELAVAVVRYRHQPSQLPRRTANALRPSSSLSTG